MSLVELRRSITGIIAVYKTTSAMRILAMSLHGHAKKVCARQERFLEECENLLRTVFAQSPQQRPSGDARTLCVIIGSQKGLCGNHNYSIAQAARSYVAKENRKNTTFMVIGKKISELLSSFAPDVFVLPGLTKNNMVSTARTIQAYAKQNKCTFVQFISARSKNLFTNFIATPSLDLMQVNELSSSVFTGHFSSLKTANFVKDLHVSYKIELILHQAFLAEQAARFVAMDSASKNAEEAIVQKKMLYNKLRKMHITKELQDLAGHWASD